MSVRKQAPAPAADAGRRDLMIRLYRQMFLIRRFEEAAAKAYAQGKIGGFLHLSIGQESVCAGALAALADTDWVFCSYREHGHALARGLEPRAVMAELFAKEAGSSKGRGGSMHVFDVSKAFLGGHAIVGGHVPLAVGTAFASKYRSDGRVTVCFFGEGSISQGAFHEGASLAALWKLPVILLCENNHYAMGTSLERSVSVKDLTVKALSYDISRDRFVADDVLTVYDRVKEAADRARQEGTPTLIEAITYRFRGHSMADPAKYRTREEVEEWRKRDCLLVGRTNLIETFGMPEADVQKMEDEIEGIVADAVQFAEESPEPDPADVAKYVYAEGEE
jgi:pyruvate dehydrogenase E1 component alpha subunit